MNIERGCTIQIAQPFFILAPRVVVKIPILKLANRNIPKVMKNKDVSFDNTMLAAIPITTVKSQIKFPNKDA